MPFTTHLNELLLKHEFSSADHTPTTTHYIGLSTSTPDQDGTGVTEPGGGSYARVSMTNNTTNWVATSPQPSDGSYQIENGTTIQFPDATASWGTITHFVIYDAATNGNLLAFGALDSAKDVVAEDSASFPPGSLKISLD